MRKYLFMSLAVFVAVTSLFLASCSSSDDNDSVISGNIVGTWKLNSFNTDETKDVFGDQYIQFKSDGTFVEVDVHGSVGESEIIRGKWIQTGSQIAISHTDVFGIDPATLTDISQLTEAELTLTTLGTQKSYKRVLDSYIEKYF